MNETKRFRTSRRSVLKSAAAVGAVGVVGTTSRALGASAAIQDSAVTLEVWGGVPAENGPGDLIAGFEAAFPNIKINYTQYVNDDTGNTQLDTALQGGTSIDVFFTYAVPRLGQRIEAGAAADLTSYVAADEKLAAWADGNEGLFRYEDKLYSLPTCSEPNYVFVNRNLLEAKGKEVPKAGWTVDEFKQLAQDLTSDTTFGTYTPPDTARAKLGPNYWYNADGTASNFDNPAFSEYLSLHKEMIDAGSAFPWTDVLAQDLKTFGQQGLFVLEQIALWPSASWVLQYLTNTEEYPREFIASFAPLPRPADVEEPWNPGGINNWLQMNARTEHPDEAWEFIRYWLTDGAVFMLKGGKVPAFPGIDQETIVKGILGDNAEALFDVEAYRAVALDPNARLVVDTITTGSAEINAIYQGTRDQFLIGELSLEEWVTETKTQSDEAIAKASA